MSSICDMKPLEQESFQVCGDMKPLELESCQVCVI